MSKFIELCDAIVTKSPYSKKYTEHIRKIRSYIELQPFDEFYEPVSVIEQLENSQKLAVISPELLNSWIQHIRFSSRVKMLELEYSILHNVLENHLMSSMVLIRSHMESAGLVAYCHNKLHHAVKKGDLSELEYIIPKTFFGTSMYRAGKSNDSIKYALTFTERDKISTSKLINALEETKLLGFPGGTIQGFYALLCEFSHSNIRAVRDYTDTQEVDPEGWNHTYKNKLEFDSDSYKMTLELLSYCMVYGHTLSEILGKTFFTVSDNQVRFNFPNEDEIRHLWSDLVTSPNSDF